MLTVIASIAAGSQAVFPAVFGAALVGVGFWVIARRWQRARRPGAVGTSIGLALVAVLWAVVPAVRSAALFVLAGTALYILLGEYDRFRRGREYDGHESTIGGN